MDVIEYMWSRSNVPKAQWKVHNLTPDPEDVEAYDRLNHIKEYVWSFFYQHHHHLIICGKNLGCGKTSWALKIMGSYFSQCSDDFDGIDVDSLDRVVDKGVFLPTVSFLADLKQFGSNEKSRQLYERVKKSELVIFDDVAAVPMSKYDYNILYALADTRIFAGLPCIFTTNAVSEDELAKELGPRIAARIWRPSTIIEIKGKGYRGVK